MPIDMEVQDDDLDAVAERAEFDKGYAAECDKGFEDAVATARRKWNLKFPDDSPLVPEKKRAGATATGGGSASARGTIRHER